MAYTTINKSGDYFNTKLFTGNGGTQSITGVGFQPDWVWLKSRSVADSSILFDAVRGVTKRLMSNSTGAETTEAQEVQSFDSDGFTVGNSDNANRNNATMVGWNWKANGAGSSNTDGSITSTVSANTTAGFSIVKWTGNNGAGATVGHGLGVVPKIVLVKNIQQSGYDWVMYHASLGNTKRIWLNLTNAVSTNTGSWNNTTPSSSVFTLGSSGETNGSGEMIGYCFAEKQGYSKFGSYTGNGNADGSFIYTGFKPAWVMIKKTNDTHAWRIYDGVRDTHNLTEKILEPNTSNAEATSGTYVLDLVSNGFKFRGNGDGVNGSGQSFIYMAFAEAPLVGTNGVTAKAR
jgi:hypothetical protein